jgi:FHS family L-fucose permease-like MFS transporter
MPIAFTPTETEGKDGSPLVPRGNRAAFALVTGLFFLWGIPNNLNDVLIRQFMKAFEITRLQAGLVQSAFYIGYFVMSIPAAIVMRRYGYKRGLQVGLLLYASGTFLFLPAAHTSSYALFLIALFVIATGLGFLETGANPLVTQLGDAHSSVRRLNFSQAFNPLGSIMGVLIGTVFIFSGVELSPAQIEHLKAAGEYGQYLHAETLRVLAPYLALGVIVLVWALLLSKTPFPEVDTNRSGGSDEMSQGGYSQLLNYPHTLLAVLAQFCYVGAQVGTWSYFIQYVQDYTHVSEKTAGYLLTGTLVGFAVGRFTSSQVMRVVEPGRLMGIFALVNIALVAASMAEPGWFGMIALFSTSFFMSLMFPTIFALGLRGLGPNTKPASSLIVMAIIGGAVFTPLMGFAYEGWHSMALAMVIPLACYLLVAAYAFWGSNLRPRSGALKPMKAT